MAVHTGNDRQTKVVTLETENNIIKHSECAVEPTVADVGIRPNLQKRKQESRPVKKTRNVQIDDQFIHFVSLSHGGKKQLYHHTPWTTDICRAFGLHPTNKKTIPIRHQYLQ